MAEDIEGRKISELAAYPGGLPKAAQQGAEFPVASAAQNFKLKVSEIQGLVEGRIRDALSGKAEAADLESLSIRVSNVLDSHEHLDALFESKQDVLIQGDNIRIEGREISAIDTIYDDSALNERIDSEASERSSADALLQTQIEALQGAIIYLGNISQTTAQITANPALLTQWAQANGCYPLKTGYVIIDSQANDWWWNGMEWVNIGYYEVATATNASKGVVKGSTADLKVSVDGSGEMSVNNLQAKLDAKQNTLTPGANIQISGSTISATQPSSLPLGGGLKGTTNAGTARSMESNRKITNDTEFLQFLTDIGNTGIEQGTHWQARMDGNFGAFGNSSVGNMLCWRREEYPTQIQCVYFEYFKGTTTNNIYAAWFDSSTLRGSWARMAKASEIPNIGAFDRAWTNAEIDTSTARPGDSLVRRSPAGYLAAHYLNQQSNQNENPVISQIMVTNSGDNYLRKASLAHVKSSLAITKSDVGLGNVDNTSDASKPISTAVQNALNGKQNSLTLPLPIASGGTGSISIDVSKFKASSWNENVYEYGDPSSFNQYVYLASNYAMYRVKATSKTRNHTLQLNDSRSSQVAYNMPLGAVILVIIEKTYSEATPSDQVALCGRSHLGFYSRFFPGFDAVITECYALMSCTTINNNQAVWARLCYMNS